MMTIRNGFFLSKKQRIIPENLPFREERVFYYQFFKVISMFKFKLFLHDLQVQIQTFFMIYIIKYQLFSRITRVLFTDLMHFSHHFMVCLCINNRLHFLLCKSIKSGAYIWNKLNEKNLSMDTSFQSVIKLLLSMVCKTIFLYYNMFLFLINQFNMVIWLKQRKHSYFA